MQLADVKHLAVLARLDISDEEAKALLHDLEATIAYVDQVTKAPISNSDISISDHRNIAREDVVTTQTGEHTDVLLAEAPATVDGFVKVKKIL